MTKGMPSVAAFSIAAAFFFQAPASAQTAASVRTWVGHTAEIEAHLKTASVESLTWKVLPPGRRSGFWESYKSEIAAYELDKLLNMNMVPPAVERQIGGETGAAIMWVEGTQSVKQIGGKVPTGAVWAKATRRLMMFDNLIGNPDRNAGNILLGPPGEMILIDHSRAFVTDRMLQQRFERVDAELWDRMTTLTRDDLKRVLGPFMNDAAIGAVLERRELMVEAVVKLIARKGQAAVIIP